MRWMLIAVFAQLFCLFLFTSCTDDYSDKAVRLNEKAYYYHYRSLDSVKVYADSVLAMDGAASVDRAEAMNNLVFYNIGRMKYSVADSLVREVYRTTDNQVELCIAGIQMMRMCQRRSNNKTFYEYRQRVQQHFNRIYEDGENANYGVPYVNGNYEHYDKRLIYAESEYRLVMSVYHYYTGQAQEAESALMDMDNMPYLRQDTVQHVAYLYNIGSGGILTRGSKEDIRHQELEDLMQCYVISADMGYTYWQANAIQALSEQLLECDINDFPDVSLARRYLNTQNVPDSLLAGFLAEESLRLFQQYGDLYQEAASWRTLAYCYSKIQDYPGAIYSLDKALQVDSAINAVPALKASIHEQFSLAFSAMNMKKESDFYRNSYLDLYDSSRQNIELEARIEELDSNVAWLNMLIYIIIAVAVMLMVTLAFLIVKRRRIIRKGKKTSRVMLLLQENKNRLDELDEQLEELQEKCAVKELELSRQQETYAEHGAKMHLINSLIPLIDRMLHETDCLCNKTEDEEQRDRRCDYIFELLARINQQNNFLTEWIKMKGGELALRIESFPLSQLFDIIGNNIATSRRQGITMEIEPTALCVKADRTLTLFMLNTICDNARKYTPQGGRINVYARETEQDMVEISIADSGQGMTQQQIDNLFDVKPVIDESINNDGGKSGVTAKSHGFGLVNCKRIIEKYKKTNSLFANCLLDVESSVGKGSRFFFRLPKGIQRTMLVLLTFAMSLTNVMAENTPASQYADSAYISNINGRYADAVKFSEKYLHKLNQEYMNSHNSKDTLMVNDTIMAVPAELRWLRDSVRVNYHELLSVRNEMAVAALALHEWSLYKYNNNAYTQLYKEMSVDPSLAVYYKQMEVTQFNSNIAIILLVLLVLSLVPIYYFSYYRYVILDVRREMNRMYDEISSRENECSQKQEQLSKLTYEYDRLYVLNNVMSNSLSAIKHETMYYPSRLQQLLFDVNSNSSELDEVARYYRAVYGMLASQAQYNSRYHLPVNVLRDMLLRTMAQLAGVRKSELTPEINAQYCVYRFEVRGGLSETKKEQIVKLNILTLLARELGELYDLRRCGVIHEGDTLTVTVPQERS